MRFSGRKKIAVIIRVKPINFRASNGSNIRATDISPLNETGPLRLCSWGGGGGGLHGIAQKDKYVDLPTKHKMVLECKLRNLAKYVLPIQYIAVATATNQQCIIENVYERLSSFESVLVTFQDIKNDVTNERASIRMKLHNKHLLNDVVV